MKNKIRHFLVDLEEIMDKEYSYSDAYKEAKEIKDGLNKLLDLINY